MVVVAGSSGNKSGRLTLTEGETIWRLTRSCSEGVGMASMGWEADGAGTGIVWAPLAVTPGEGLVWRPTTTMRREFAAWCRCFNGGMASLCGSCPKGPASPVGPLSGTKGEKKHGAGTQHGNEAWATEARSGASTAGESRRRERERADGGRGEGCGVADVDGSIHQIPRCHSGFFSGYVFLRDRSCRTRRPGVGVSARGAGGRDVGWRPQVLPRRTCITQITQDLIKHVPGSIRNAPWCPRMTLRRGCWIPSTSTIATTVAADPVLRTPNPPLRPGNHLQDALQVDAAPMLRRRCSGCVASRPTPTPTPPASSRRLRHAPLSTRGFSSGPGGRPRFSQRLGEALRHSRIQWYQIPVGVGIGFLGLVHFYRLSAREQERQAEPHDDPREPGQHNPRRKVRPEGPW